MSSSSSLTQPFQVITPINHNSGSISSQTSVKLPTSNELKDFITKFQRDEELDAIDNVKQVESDIMSTEYNRLQSYELGGTVDAIVPPSAQDVRQLTAETSTRTYQQQRSYNDFVYTLIKKRQNARTSKTKLKYTSN